MSRSVIASLVAALLVLVFGAGLAAYRSNRPRLTVSAAAIALPADGRMHRAVEVGLTHGGELRLSELQLSGLAATADAAQAGHATVSVRTPVNPGQARLGVRYGSSAAGVRIALALASGDSFGDGTPDFLRLHTSADRLTFRNWFSTLADIAAALPRARLPKEIDDCAALLRWCYRGALHTHDEAWQQMVPLGDLPPLPSIEQYAYPQTPLGVELFRVRPGPFALEDLHNGSFAQFADARTLWQNNTFFVSRNVAAARPGDLLFFRQLEQDSPYHSMIVTGRRHDWVVYHTGPIGEGSTARPGEIRRMTVDDLLHHPDSRWHPISQNSNFLGVYRWTILREDLP